MASSFSLPRRFVILAVVLPMAAVIGYLLATPQDISSVALVGLVFSILLIPFLMRWHHPLLIVSWNASIILFFLPGRPSVWMGLAIVSLGFSLLDRLLTKRETFVYVPSIVWPLIILAIVLLVTSQLTGGFGFRVLGGGSFGGKRYFYVLAAILGFFALASQQLPRSKARIYAGLFFLSGLTAIISNLIYLAPDLYFLYYLFPPEYAYGQAFTDFSVQSTVLRLTGIAVAGPACYYCLLSQYGIRGLLVL